jgi:DNA-nicking Smr family endonuclease
MSRKRKRLSPEDEALWDRVKGATSPLHPVQRRVEIPAKLTATVALSPKKHTEYTIPKFAIGTKAGGGRNGHDLQPALVDRLNHAPVQMDRKNYTRMKRGKLVPEARIDLHGMTLAAAHPRLMSFILRAHGDGARLALVITGKGKNKPDEGPIPTRHGVLRHQVPQWLSMPPLGALVLQIAPAHQSHGGTGAYYVYLRRGR